MSLIRFNNRKRLFPSWTNDSLESILSSDDFFNNDFFEEDSLMPAMNVIEHKDYFEIEFAAPGFEKKDFEVTIKNNILDVSGEKTYEAEEKEEKYKLREFSYNSFKRLITLPKFIDTNQEVKATYKDGILKLNLQKLEDAKEHSQKVIEVV